MSTLLLLVAPLLVLALHDAVRRPSFRRLAIRNIARRPAEAALVVVGSMLGTAIITAAFIVGDTFDASIRDIARTELGPTDQVVRVQDPEVARQARDLVLAEPLAGTDGVLALVRIPVAASSAPSEAQLAELSIGETFTTAAVPDTSLGEVDFDAARAFGGDAASTGLEHAGATPRGDEAVLDARVAAGLAVEAGDRVSVHAYGTELDLVVRDVVPQVGLAGYVGIYVAPGTIEGLHAASAVLDARPPTHELLVSNTGGVFDGAAGTEAVLAELERRTVALEGVEVQPIKQDLLDEAAATGESIGQLFTSIGAFSVLVGILLLVNLFVMLAEERKSELGMLRAVGLKRNHLMRSFVLEGAAYSVVAAVLGAVVGIGVGAAIVAVTENIIANGNWELTFVFSAEPASVITGALIGLLISLVTVAATSARIARLNVIRAIRDLAEPTSDRVGPVKLAFASLGILAGATLAFAGIAGESAVPALAGPPLALLASIPLARRVLGRRRATVAASALALLWSIAVFNVAPEAMASPGIEIFVVQGVVMVTAAVGMASQADRFWARLADRSSASPNGLSVRLALAYPLARSVRTGIQLGMFSLVVFTMTFMSVFSGIFASQAGSIADSARGSADLYVDSNPSNPVAVADLEARPDVDRAVPLLRAFTRYSTSWRTEPAWWPITGIDDRLLELGAPGLSAVAPGYGSHDDVWQAVLADPSLAVVSDWLLQDGAGPPTDRVRAGDEITIDDPVSGVRTVTAVALTDSDWVGNGVFVSRQAAEDVVGADRAVENRHYVKVTAGADPDEVAAALTAVLVPNGGQAETFLAFMETELNEQVGFFRLMQGYLALGLLIGIAGLGVVMVRAVRERRRQVGMLRATGVSALVVRRAFLLEAAFVAAQGIAIGIVLGLACSYQVLTRSATFGDQPLPFEVPWAGLAILLVVPLGAAMLASAVPAAQAARIRPAAALRMAD